MLVFDFLLRKCKKGREVDSDKEILNHIRNRTKAENKLISLEKILRAYHMEMYLRLCGNRIADAELIDGEHILLDFSNIDNLLFDSYGIGECFDILSGYVKEEELINIWRYARNNDKITMHINNELDILRNSDIKTLFVLGFNFRKVNKVIREYGKDQEFSKEDIEDFSKKCKAEIFSRNPFNKARVWIADKAMHLYLKIKYWNIFYAMKNIARENAQNNL